MANIDLPNTRAFMGATLSVGVDVATSGARGFYTGNTQSVGHADRLRAMLTLGPCTREHAGLREAFIFGLISRGDKLRMGMAQRRVPLGTLRGALVAAAPALAGARLLQVSGGTALGTLVGGDFLGVGGNLIQCAYPGPSASGAGDITVPLTLPLQRAVAAGAPVVWDRPSGLWELDTAGLQLDYIAPIVQQGVALPLRQYIP